MRVEGNELYVKERTQMYRTFVVTGELLLRCFPLKSKNKIKANCGVLLKRAEDIDTRFISVFLCSFSAFFTPCFLRSFYCSSCLYYFLPSLSLFYISAILLFFLLPYLNFMF
jgi:hypothetical protein